MLSSCKSDASFGSSINLMHIKGDATIYKIDALQLLPGIACQTRIERHISVSFYLCSSVAVSLGNDGFGCVIVMIRMNSMRNCLAQHDENVRLNKMPCLAAVWFIYFYTRPKESATFASRSKD